MRIIEQLVIEGMRKSPGISDEECSDAFFEKGEGSADVELAAGWFSFILSNLQIVLAFTTSWIICNISRRT